MYTEYLNNEVYHVSDCTSSIKHPRHF
uniref:Uncharacterized protein n=1 Tax=Anguilla anguilla TaxID=7936 RepID=A0A0E9XAM9_ANGAN